VRFCPILHSFCHRCRTNHIAGRRVCDALPHHTPPDFSAVAVFVVVEELRATPSRLRKAHYKHTSGTVQDSGSPRDNKKHFDLIWYRLVPAAKAPPVQLREAAFSPHLKIPLAPHFAPSITAIMTSDLDDFMNQHDGPVGTSMEDQSDEPPTKKRKQIQDPEVSSGIGWLVLWPTDSA